MAVMVLSALMVPLILIKIRVYGEPQVPCYFTFGPSYYDNGNNNLLPTLSKANYYPYGIDFPGGSSTGRFTNGNNTADFLAKILGFADYIPPFATAAGQDILKGVNYASGGSGIRSETGRQLGVAIRMEEQLRNHRVTVSRIAEILGSEDAANLYLNKCLYSAAMGVNDYINNYFMPQFYPTSTQYTPHQYSQVLIRQYYQQLTFVQVWSKKGGVFGPPQIGCSPSVVLSAGTNGSQCVDSVNDPLLLFNSKLPALVDELNEKLEGGSFLTVNTYSITSISSIGVKVINDSCCERVPGTPLCDPLRSPCSNRDDYLWWDGLHQTQIVREIVANRAYNAQSPSDTYPFHVHRILTQHRKPSSF